jgi:DNA-binding SARP family transcriptional activator/DNA-binding beta-propeller fold protein YncE
VRVEYRILGPLEVVDEGEPVPLGRLKERLVLAVLLLHANEFVSRERLIDELWGESPPATARKAVNVYVSQLRKALTRNGRDPIATADGGYRLEVDADELDLAHLRQLLASARERAAAGELDAAAKLLREALALWRGATLAGLLLESHGRGEVAQLDELRLTALMDRIDCDLALGRQEEVLGELHVLVGEHPLRERLRAQLMLALYRADRQADALDAYQQAREVLVEELGIEPSPALQRLQQAILRHDSSLETPTGTAAVNGMEPLPAASVQAPTAHPDRASLRPLRRPRWWNLDVRPPLRRPRRWRLALAVLLILVACVPAATILSSPSRPAPHVVPNSLVRLDPRSGKIASVVRVGLEPGPIAVTPSAVWTANEGDGTISRYDLRTHGVQTRGGFPYQPYDVVADADGHLWVTSYATPIVTRLAAGIGAAAARPLDPSKSETIRVPGPAVGYEALGAGYLWATVGPYTSPGEDDRLSLIDLASNQVVDSIRLGHATTALAFGDGAAWVGTFINEPKGQPPPFTGPSWLYVIRAGDRPGQPFLDRHPLRRLLETGDTAGPVAIAVGEGSVWVLMCGVCNLGASGYKTLLKVDPDTRQVLKRIPLHRETDFLAAGAGSVWVTGQADDSVWQLDPNTGRIVRAIHMGNKDAVTCGITATPKAVWVAIGDRKCGFP